MGLVITNIRYNTVLQFLVILKQTSLILSW